MQEAGISSIGVALPSLGMRLDTLAELRGVDPDKYAIGLRCRSMALCGPDDTVVSMAVDAARKALSRWGGDLGDIGMIAVGTETARDMSRPLSAFVADSLELSGSVRSYEVKHACYAGTLALRQALEWQWSGVARGKHALVVATDKALYAPGHPGEPTQGAAAVAMVIGEPRVAAVDRVSFAFSRPVFDFYRPVGVDYPTVDGALSLDSYRDAVAHTFRAWSEDIEAPFTFDAVDRVAFHCPFPKMAEKGFARGAEALGFDEREAIARLFATRVAPSLGWNADIGNCYTASSWIATAQALAASDVRQLATFSYGSGCGAELVLLHRQEAGPTPWVADVEDAFEARQMLDAQGYESLRNELG